MTSHAIIDKGNSNQFFRKERNRGVFMKKIAVLLHTVFLIAFVSVSYAQQSLADLAKQEKERREEIKNNRVITNEEAASYIKEAPASPALPEQPAGTAHPDKRGSEAVNKPQTDNPEADEPTDFEGRPESFWRNTMAEARQQVKDLTNEANVIVLKIADLKNEFYRTDSGFKQRGDLQREIQKSYYEQDLNKENLEKAKMGLQDLENDARKSGALPGWLAP
jgi:preprotein translocase subunit SecG